MDVIVPAVPGSFRVVLEAATKPDLLSNSSLAFALQHTEEGKISGKIREGGPNLDGLKVGGHYKFHCDEEIEEVGITGRESHKLYLNRHEPV